MTFRTLDSQMDYFIKGGMCMAFPLVSYLLLRYVGVIPDDFLMNISDIPLENVHNGDKASCSAAGIGVGMSAVSFTLRKTLYSQSPSSS